MWIPTCTCEQGKDPLRAMIIEEVPDLPRRYEMSDRQREYATVIRCGHCKTILKYFGTITWFNPKTGQPGHRTVTLQELAG